MPKSILIIDTEQQFRDEFSQTMQMRGWDVRSTDNPETAWKMLFETPADVVTVDAQLEGATPIDLVYQLLHYADMPLTVLVSHKDKDLEKQEQAADELGVDLIVQKPDAPKKIADVIVTLVDSSRESHMPPSVPAAALEMEATGSDDRALQLAQLREDYGTKIPGFFADIGKQLVQTTIGTHQAESLEEAYRLAHSVTGTSGTLGFPETGTVAGAMERAIKEMMRLKHITTLPPGMPFDDQFDTQEGISSIRSAISANPGRAIMASVLVIDDDREFLAQIVAIGLENLIRVHPASTGAEAMLTVQNHQVDCAIIDVNLGENEDAFKTARDLRSVAGLTELPISFISADTGIPTRIAAAHAGASQYLDKPISAADFVSAVRHLTPSDKGDQAKILVVDDDPSFLENIKIVLSEENMSVEILSEPSAVLDVIEKNPPDLVLLDVVMQQVSGFDVCRVLRSTEKWSALPIIFLTGHPAFDTRVGCFQAGGDDFIEKPIVREELLARINVRLERLRFFRERADIDTLTGLPTRRAFVEMFKMRLSEGRRYGKPVSLCLLDLDHFKQINDTYGHLAGDRVLSSLGQLLMSRFRTIDVRGRWGGEEFVLAFYGETSETTKMIIGRMQEEFNKLVFKGDYDEKFRVKFSAGIASFPDEGETFEEIFHAVDRKLYKAKDAGRNRIER